jgi:hypothetical protein
VSFFIRQYWSIRKIPPCTILVADKGMMGHGIEKNKSKGEKAQILIVRDTFFLEYML